MIVFNLSLTENLDLGCVIPDQENSISQSISTAIDSGGHPEYSLGSQNEDQRTLQHQSGSESQTD
jgi:hypothetical protein